VDNLLEKFEVANIVVRIAPCNQQTRHVCEHSTNHDKWMLQHAISNLKAIIRLCFLHKLKQHATLLTTGQST